MDTNIKNIKIDIKWNEKTLMSKVLVTAYNKNKEKIHETKHEINLPPTPSELSYIYEDFMDDIKVITHSADYGMIVKESKYGKENT